MAELKVGERVTLEVIEQNVCNGCDDCFFGYDDICYNPTYNGGCYESRRTKVLGIRVDKRIYCKLDGKKSPRWYNIDRFKLIEEG